MEIKSVTLEIPEGCNIIVGHSHFIKTVEDLHEIMVGISCLNCSRVMLRNTVEHFLRSRSASCTQFIEKDTS